MSSQSIEDFNINDTCNKIQDFLRCEGKLFSNIVDYDLNEKINYNKLNKLILFQDILDRNCRKEEILLIINKLLK